MKASYDCLHERNRAWVRQYIRHRELGVRSPLGHGNELSKVLYSSLSASYSWDESQSLRGVHHGGVFNLEFSPDGSLLVAACEKRSFLMFDPLTHKQIHAVENAHRDCVNCVRFLDSRTFVTCSDDSTVALWDARNLKSRIRTLHGHSNWVKNIEYSQKDGLLVTSGFDGSIYSWDINSYTEHGFMYERVFHTNGLMRTRLTPDASKMVICTTGGYLMIIHDLNLHTLSQDLHGFKPNMYRLMQQSQTTIPAASAFTTLFSKRRKRNRIEFVSDFPTHNDAEVVSSLQIHPQGWCALSRNISHEETSEWTCIHDIQDHSDEAPTSDDDSSATFRDDVDDVLFEGGTQRRGFRGFANSDSESGSETSWARSSDNLRVSRGRNRRIDNRLSSDSSSVDSSDDETGSSQSTVRRGDRSTQQSLNAAQRQRAGRFHALLETTRHRNTTTQLLNDGSSVFREASSNRRPSNVRSNTSTLRRVHVGSRGSESHYSDTRDDDEPPSNVRVVDNEGASNSASSSSTTSPLRGSAILSGSRRRTSRPGISVRGGRFLRSGSQVNSVAAAAMAAAAASSAAAAAMQAAQTAQALPHSRRVAAAQIAALAGREAATAALDAVSDSQATPSSDIANRVDRAAEVANRAAAAASRSVRNDIASRVDRVAEIANRAAAAANRSRTARMLLADRFAAVERAHARGEHHHTEEGNPGTSGEASTAGTSNADRNAPSEASSSNAPAQSSPARSSTSAATSRVNAVDANMGAVNAAARRIALGPANSPFSQNMELHVASADVWEALVVIREARARRQHVRNPGSLPQDRRGVISRFVQRLQELQPRVETERGRGQPESPASSSSGRTVTFTNAAGTVTTTSMIGNNNLTTDGSTPPTPPLPPPPPPSVPPPTNADLSEDNPDENMETGNAAEENGNANAEAESEASSSMSRPMRLARRIASRNASRNALRNTARNSNAAIAVGNFLSNPTPATRSLVLIAPNDQGAQNIQLRVSPNSFSYQSQQIRMPRNHKIHQNSPRLLHYIEEPNVGKGFIKELCFSSDGRVMCSPFGHGVRILAFSPDCQEISTCLPSTPPVKLFEVSSRMSHSDYVVSSKFSPTHCLLVSGCLKGKIVWHHPLL